MHQYRGARTNSDSVLAILTMLPSALATSFQNFSSGVKASYAPVIERFKAYLA